MGNNEHEAVALLLLQHGANAHAASNWGTPLSTATKKQLTRVLAVMSAATEAGEA